MSDWDIKIGAPLITEIIPDNLEDDWTREKGLQDLTDAIHGMDAESQTKIAEMGLQVICMLLEKNKSYGDSALNPVRIFSKDLNRSDGLHVRMDDKLSRIARGAGEGGGGESPKLDLVGYLILDLIADYEDRRR